jgi:deoxyribodipyrimidine photolyase
MPNYTRHVVAGFLIEYLNVDWRHGQLWFHDTLVDADVAIQVRTNSLLSVSKYPITTQSPPNH